MIEFIINEENNELKEIYEMVIFSFFGYREDSFKIYNYKDYKLNKSNNKIYILSDENTKIAKCIRESNDWTSPIIIIGKNENNHDKLLVLDYIEIDDYLKENLKLAIDVALKILSTKKSLTLIINNEIYKIPYQDILFIEKGNNQNNCIIHTNNNTYTINETLKNLEEILDKCNFIKTHRSCIVNLNNIKSYNIKENTISFDNIEIDLISRDKRKLLKDTLLENKVKSND